MGKEVRFGARHLLYGLWGGWTGVLLVARLEIIHFAVKAPPYGILNYCYLNGYPKQRDYFWFGAMIVGGFLGVLITRLVLSFLIKRTRVQRSRIFALAGIVSALMASLFGLSSIYGRSSITLMLYMGGVLFPWLDGRWYREPKSIENDFPDKRGFRGILCWVVVCVLISALWAFDAAFRCRKLDGIHEGSQLLYVQGILDGILPGVGCKAEYGPLSILGLYGWMKLFGISVCFGRLYFLVMQALGTAIHLALFRVIGLNWIATTICTLLILTHSSITGVQYGIVTAMRTAMPLLAIVIYWRGRGGNRKLIILSGLLQSISLMFSPEYGMASMAAISAIFLRGLYGKRDHVNRMSFIMWVAVSVIGIALISLAIYGKSAFGSLVSIILGSYGLPRLLGHLVLPFPEFKWWTKWELARLFTSGVTR